MAKKSIIHREFRKVLAAARGLAKRLVLRAENKNPNLDFEEKLDVQAKMQKLKRNSSSSRVRRRCFKCGRPRGVYRKFGLCRIHLREALMRGDVPGGRKASW